MKFINIDILKNPINWVTILLMLVIFGIFADMVVGNFTKITDTVIN